MGVPVESFSKSKNGFMRSQMVHTINPWKGLQTFSCLGKVRGLRSKVSKSQQNGFKSSEMFHNYPLEGQKIISFSLVKVVPVENFRVKKWLQTVKNVTLEGVNFRGQSLSTIYKRQFNIPLIRIRFVDFLLEYYREEISVRNRLFRYSRLSPTFRRL